VEDDLETYRVLRKVRLGRLAELRKIKGVPKGVFKNEQILLLSTRILLGYSENRYIAARVKYYDPKLRYSGRM
jgi:hypothetical protein